MNVAAFEGVVDDGKIRLMPGVRLPDRTKVFVIVPDLGTTKKAQILSPRLAHPEQMPYFKKELVEDLSDADV